MLFNIVFRLTILEDNYINTYICIMIVSPVLIDILYLHIDINHRNIDAD